MVLALCTAWTGAAAQQIGAPSAATQLEQLTRAHAAVVGIRVTVADGASSAESLGRQRAGSGVLIERTA